MANFWKLGLSATDTPANVVSIASGPTTTGHYMTFEYPVGTDYVVPSGKTLYISRILLHPGLANTACQFGYADVGQASGAGVPSGATFVSWYIGTAAANITVSLDVQFVIPQNKYPFLKSITNDVYVQAIGVLA